MPKYEARIRADLDHFIDAVTREIKETSATSSLEDVSDCRVGDNARMFVLGFERYSAFGGNRVSLTISVLAVGDDLGVCAIATGGSQAMFWKLTTLSEETFLNKAINAIERFK